MITSTSNARIKYVEKLIKSSSARKLDGVFVVEGERICREVPADRVHEAFMSESFYNKLNGADSALGKTIKSQTSQGLVPDECNYMGYTCTVVSDGAFKKMSDTVTGQGILCVVTQNQMSADDYLDMHVDGRLRLLILEGIQDPGNLGTMIRTAEAAGFDAIIADASTVDVYNPKVIRSTMGGIFRLPVLKVDNLRECISRLKRDNITLYAALLEGSVDYRSADYADRIGILIGNEGNGLTAETAGASDVHVRIPMAGQVESLNAAVAASILMYEVGR